MSKPPIPPSQPDINPAANNGQVPAQQEKQDRRRAAAIVCPTWGDHGPSFGKFIVIWALSTLINVSMVGGALLLFSLLPAASAAETATPEVEQQTEIADATKEYDLTNTDLGTDDSVPLAYNVDRIEEVSVPGMVDPTAPVGIQGAPEAAPMNVPPPPGAGGGTGLAALDPNVAGVGSMAGTLGGMGGIYNAGGFGGRSGATREKLLQEGGGNARSEAAVASGLKFLAHHQAPDGRWSLHEFNKFARTAPLPAGKIVPDNSQPMYTQKNDTAGTAFGLLPFLAAGITHRPSKNPKQVDYSKGVGKAIDYLISIQSKASADRGFYTGGSGHQRMYSHALATIAMCEAYGLTSDPKVKASAQLALNHILDCQDPQGGGWRYSPKQAGDTSVTGWALMALKSGQMAGLTVPKAALTRTGQFLDSCETSNKGGYSYTAGTGGESMTMTAVGALCRQYLGVNPRNQSLLASIRRIKQYPPDSPTYGHNLYYMYYATQVMHHMGGDAWQFWNLGKDGTGKGGIRDTLISRQSQAGDRIAGNVGSWPGDGHVGGRLGGTALSLLTLEVYYRHLPLYRRDAGMKTDK